MDPTKKFEDLVVWKKSHQFVLQAYLYTAQFPKTETFGLVSQFRRAAVSIPANIAEGYKKKSTLDKMRFLNIAQGSLEECRYYLILARDLNYGSNQKLMEMLEEASRLIDGYIKGIQRNSFESLNS